MILIVVALNFSDQVAKKDTSDEGPVIERKCPKCSSEKMSYAAIQVTEHLVGSMIIYFSCVLQTRARQFSSHVSSANTRRVRTLERGLNIFPIFWALQFCWNFR